MKPQFTEEEARDILYCIYVPTMQNFNTIIKRLGEHGYIRKSDLEILIEEAEDMYSMHVEYKGNLSGDEKNNVIDKLYRTIQSMKAELNKRRDI